ESSGPSTLAHWKDMLAGGAGAPSRVTVSGVQSDQSIAPSRLCSNGGTGLAPDDGVLDVPGGALPSMTSDGRCDGPTVQAVASARVSTVATPTETRRPA